MATVVDRFVNAALGAAANEVPFLGRDINFPPFNGYLEVAVGGGAGLTMDITVGGRAIATGVPIQLLAAAPVIPDNLDIQDERVWADKPIQIRVNNPTAGPLAYWAYARLSDVPRGAR